MSKFHYDAFIKQDHQYLTESDIEMIKNRILTTRAVLSEDHKLSSRISKYYEAGKTFCELIRYLVTDGTIHTPIKRITIEIDPEKRITRFELYVPDYIGYLMYSTIVDTIRVDDSLMAAHEKWSPEATAKIILTFTNYESNMPSDDTANFKIEVLDITRLVYNNIDHRTIIGTEDGVYKSTKVFSGRAHGIVSYAMNFPIPTIMISEYNKLVNDSYMEMLKAAAKK